MTVTMARLDFTLLTDGSSDDILIHPITWIFRQHLHHLPVNGEWANPYRFQNRPKDLRGRIQAALEFYPCDLLFIHRDAEKIPLERRVAEIEDAVIELPTPQVPVVPVRMQEAWFLIDEAALRHAAGNPNGQVNLAIPAINKLEQINDPKKRLHDLLLQASELTGRKRKKFNPRGQARRLGELIEDYSPLRELPAFRHVEDKITATLRDHFGMVSMLDQATPD